MQCVRGNVSNFDTISLPKGENGLEEIIICKVIDESHMGNLELTCLDPCSNDLILYTIDTNDTWIHSMDDVSFFQMVYADEGGKRSFHQPSLSKIKA
jgi:hypothetical protein